MAPDRIAEISSLETVVTPIGNGNLPRWANPIFAARLILAALTGFGAAAGVDFIGRLTASAQTACKSPNREFTVVGMQVPFLDMARIVLEHGRKGIFDKGTDPYLETPALGGQLKVVDPTSKRELSSSNFTAQPPRIPNVQLPHSDENLAWAVGRWCATPNSTMTLKDGQRVLAVEVIIKSSQHPENESYRVTVPADGILPNWFGREVKNLADFLEMADKKVAPVHDLDAKKEKLIRDWLVTQKVAVTGAVTATVTAGVTPTVTAAAIPTAGASGVYYTEEVRTALEKVMTDRLDKATKDLQQGQKENFDKLSQRIKGLEGGQDKLDKLDKKLTDIEGKLPITATVPTTTTVPAAGIGLPDLSGIKETPLLGEIVQALDLPAKVLDQVTEPDTQPPLRAGIDVLAWLVLLRLLKRVPKVGIVGIPGAYILGTSSYPIRYGIAKRKHSRDVAAATAAGQLPPVWNRPKLSI